jgi:hypothetical protein
MVLSDVQPQRADQIFRTGPETLVAEASTIVAGPVTDYSRKVLSMSQPESDGFPLKWVASGQIGPAQLLKGQSVPASLRFSRTEHSPFVPPDGSTLYWEDAYGELQSGEPAVLFVSGGAQGSVFKVIPSGSSNGQDFISLVKDIVRIQDLRQEGDSKDRWLQYLRTTSSDEGRKAALRSLVNAPVEWVKLAPELNRLVSSDKNSSDIRAFAFDSSFAVNEQFWYSNPSQWLFVS